MPTKVRHVFYGCSLMSLVLLAAMLSVGCSASIRGTLVNTSQDQVRAVLAFPGVIQPFPISGPGSADVELAAGAKHEFSSSAVDRTDIRWTGPECVYVLVQRPSRSSWEWSVFKYPIWHRGLDTGRDADVVVLVDDQDRLVVQAVERVSREVIPAVEVHSPLPETAGYHKLFVDHALFALRRSFHSE